MQAPHERRGLVSGGNWIIDHVKLIDKYPDQDTLASIVGRSRGTGGAPYNVLINLAKMQAPFPLAGVGLVGDDEDGRTIVADCMAAGINMEQVRTTQEAGTSYTDVMSVQSTGRRTFFHSRGANSLLDDADFHLEDCSARILHLGYLLLLDRMDVVAADGTTGASRLLRRARALGIKTSVDVVSEHSDRFPRVVTPALPHTDYLIVNELEASKSSGVNVMRDGALDFALVSRAAARLLELGVREWVVVHAPEGALARHKDGTVHLQGSVAMPPEKIAGTAGAGDAFATGTLLGLHEGWPMPECLRMGACAAATSLLHPTCTGGLLPTDACLRFGADLGFRAPPGC
jgi:sugar/nucleoside kinase (ribokinase family)